MPHSTVNLAIEAVRYFLANGKPLPRPENLGNEFNEKFAVFVSIKENRNLRGCIGSITPKTSNLGNEIILNAVKAATKDPRFPPISKLELSNLTFSIDVLTPLEAIEGLSEHNPKKYGLVVKNGSKSGLLLPDLEGVKTAEKQMEICKKKAGISASENVELFRFEVKRYF
jgi:AmmeMemoRadiSam system protein A